MNTTPQRMVTVREAWNRELAGCQHQQTVWRSLLVNRGLSALLWHHMHWFGRYADVKLGVGEWVDLTQEIGLARTGRVFYRLSYFA